MLGSATLSWTVVTGSSTELLGKKGDHPALTLADLKVGDLMNFEGALASGTSLTVNAKVVRDLSSAAQAPVSAERDIFQGTLQSLASTTAPTSLKLATGNKTYTVNVAANTTILKSNFTATTLAAFQTGDTVRIYGSVNAADSSVIDALIVRDASR
jgi:hypothetical protein